METHSSSTARLLDASLIGAPALYLLTDSLYAARGWDDGNVAALNMVAAIVYGLAIVRLVLMASGTLRTAMAVTAAVGVPASYGVAINTLHVSYGHADLFDLDGPANAFKMVGFLFPLTLLLGAIAIRGCASFWVPVTLAIGAVLFPVAHVANNSTLAIVDGLLLLAALARVWQITRIGRVSPARTTGSAREAPRSSTADTQIAEM